jgi:hypothetical protein
LAVCRAFDPFIQGKLIPVGTFTYSDSIIYVYSDFAVSSLFMSAKGTQAISGKLEDLEPDPGSMRHGSLNESDGFNKNGIANSKRKETPAYALALSEVSPTSVFGHLRSGFHHRQR